MVKKPQKTREEKASEQFFPVDEDDLKRTTEKQVKPTSPQSPHGITEKISKKIDIRDSEIVEKMSSKKKFTRKQRAY